MSIKNIISAKTNVLGTTAIAVIASLSTVLFSNWISQEQLGPLEGSPSPAIATTVPAGTALDCDQGVYSPVQRACVDQAIFDGEMKRLFAALGIDTSIYQQGDKNTE